MRVVGMGIRVYIRNVIGGSGESDEQAEDSAEEGRPSHPGEFIRRSIVEGKSQNSQSKKPTEGSGKEGS